MRSAVLGALLVVGLVIASVHAYPDHGETRVQQADAYRSAVPEGRMIALSTTVGEAYQQVVVIDSVERVISVYHIDLATGSVEFVGLRNIDFDLQMSHFNSKEPLPSAIEDMLSRGQPR